MIKTKRIVETLRRVALFLVILPAIFGCQSIIGPEAEKEEPVIMDKKGPDLLMGHDLMGGVEAITIVYSAVQVLREVDGIGEWIDVAVGEMSEPERTFDLLTVLDGFEAILGEATIESGVYLKMRVRVEHASITLVGDESPLKIRGNALRIHEEFEVGPGGHPILPLDFNASESVRVKARGKHRYSMRGILRLAEAPPAPQTGTISGMVVPSISALVNAYVSGTHDLVASVGTDQNMDGFLFTDLPAGSYDLEASAPGYYSGWEMGVVLAAGEVSDGHVLEMEEIVGGEKR